MTDSDATCWTMIEEAAEGREEARDLFARAYVDVIRAGLAARWRHSPLRERLEDAVQDVFMDCFRARGALDRAERDRGPGFRAFLSGIVRNVARRYEERRGRERAHDPPSRFEPAELEAADVALSVAFDRAWARQLLARAVRRMEATAAESDAAARRRVDILRLRFGEGLPVREIAARFDEEAARVHREFARAREEFKRALLDEVAFHHPGGPPPAIEGECERLLALLRAE